MKYRKKPVVIEAFIYDGDLIGRDRAMYIPNWAAAEYQINNIYYKNDELFIKALEGDHHVSVGEYIIRGVQGELYTCKPDIFEQTYEEVKE